MSSSYYTRMENTVVSGSSLLSNLSGADVNALRFQYKISKNPTITLTGSTDSTTAASKSYNLTASDFVDAVVDRQLVLGSGLSAAGTLYLGPDAASQAAAYVLMFDLASGVDNKILLNFEITNAAISNNAIALANGVVGTAGSTNDHVILYANGVSAGYTTPLFLASAVSGTRKTVEVWATNTTEGSEVVVFNVLAAIGN